MKIAILEDNKGFRKTIEVFDFRPLIRLPIVRPISLEYSDYINFNSINDIVEFWFQCELTDFQGIKILLYKQK